MELTMLMDEELNKEVGIDTSKSSSLTTEKMMTSEEAAEFLGISIQSLLNRVSAGSIPYYKLGRLNRYKKSELAQLLLSNKRGKHGN